MTGRLLTRERVARRVSLLVGVVVLTFTAAAAAQTTPQSPVPAPAVQEPTALERGTALRAPVFHRRPATFKQETTTLTLQPGEGMEYKYRLELGESFLYSWRATAPVHTDLHTEPDGAPRGYSDSFEVHDAMSESHGSYTAPYPGIHGWYWQNRTKDVVVVTLTSAGFYSEAREFRKGLPVQRKAIP